MLQQERDILKTRSYFKRIRHCANRLQVICNALLQEYERVLSISWKSLEKQLDCFTWAALVNMCGYFPPKIMNLLIRKRFLSSTAFYTTCRKGTAPQKQLRGHRVSFSSVLSLLQTRNFREEHGQNKHVSFWRSKTRQGTFLDQFNI